MSVPIFQFISTPSLPAGNHKFVFYICNSVSVLYISSLYIMKFFDLSFTQYQSICVHPCCSKWCYFILLYGWVMFHCKYIPHLLYPFLCWMFQLLPCPGYCKYCWILACMYLFKLWFSLDICSGVGLLDHMVVFFL